MKEFTFKLSESEAQLILNVLSKEPYIEVVDVINSIQIQANKQLQEKQEDN